MRFRLLPSIVLFCVFNVICPETCSAVEEARKIVIITSASGELGGAAAKVLAKNYDLILTGRDVHKLKKLKEELTTSHPGQYEIITLDFISPASRERFKDYLSHNQKPISGLVLITPRPNFSGKAVIQEESVWLNVFQNTFTGPTEVLKDTLTRFSSSGKIVVISGTTSVQLQPEYGLSCVIRRMWTTYTKALSHELGPRGISINAISPGIVMTRFHEDRIQSKADSRGLTYEEQLKEEVANIPLRRHAIPEEVAQTIQFLLSEQSDFINGTNLILDGGYTSIY